MTVKHTACNWCEYNVGLKLRGNLTFWLDEVVLCWYNTIPGGKPGDSIDYNGLAIASTNIQFLL